MDICNGFFPALRLSRVCLGFDPRFQVHPLDISLVCQESRRNGRQITANIHSLNETITPSLSVQLFLCVVGRGDHCFKLVFFFRGKKDVMVGQEYIRKLYIDRTSFESFTIVRFISYEVGQVKIVRYFKFFHATGS